MTEKKEPELFEVFEENIEPLLFFCRLVTQWKRTESGFFIGLDYCAVVAMLDLFNVENRPVFFDKLQVLECAAMRQLNAKR